jgi:glycosyltransferase involved in cell wall biosynthesis
VSPPRVSIVCVTHRADPGFSAFADSLAPQIGDDAEVIVVDGLHREGRVQDDRLALRHVPAKPTAWNGPYGVTTNAYCAIASARNTGIVHARAPYVAFVDDCSVLAPGWWDELSRAAGEGAVLTGAVHTGDERDPRWSLGDDVPVGPGRLAPASFCAPRELLVQLNGFDELCDPAGHEGYNLGVRLQWAGAQIVYNRRMASTRSAARHRHDVVRRLDRTAGLSAYMSTLHGFGVSKRHFDGRLDASHLGWDVLFGRREVASIGNHYELARLTPENVGATAEQLPLTHWFDGFPLGRL